MRVVLWLKRGLLFLKSYPYSSQWHIEREKTFEETRYVYRNYNLVNTQLCTSGKGTQQSHPNFYHCSEMCTPGMKYYPGIGRGGGAAAPPGGFRGWRSLKPHWLWFEGERVLYRWTEISHGNIKVSAVTPRVTFPCILSGIGGVSYTWFKFWPEVLANLWW